MLEKIKQAENAIRNGDTKTGFEILRQVLAEDPDSERAWWIMSGLVPREQRANCLIQVLRINPDNQLAQDTLDKLVAESTQESPSPIKRQVGNYLTWLYPQRSKINITLLGKEDLITATTEPKLLARVRSAIKEDNFSPTLFRDKKKILLFQINRIKQVLNSLRVFYEDKNKEESIRLEFEDNSVAEEVLIELIKRLGDGYSQIEKPMSMASTLGIAIILILSAGGVTGFLYWGALNLPAMAALSPTAAALIGAVLLLAALGVSAGLLMKPPTGIEIVRLRLNQSSQD